MWKNRFGFPSHLAFKGTSKSDRFNRNRQLIATAEEDIQFGGWTIWVVNKKLGLVFGQSTQSKVSWEPVAQRGSLVSLHMFSLGLPVALACLAVTSALLICLFCLFV